MISASTRFLAHPSEISPTRSGLVSDFFGDTPAKLSEPRRAGNLAALRTSRLPRVNPRARQTANPPGAGRLGLAFARLVSRENHREF